MIRVLREANRIVRDRWRNTGKGWKIALVTGLVIIAILGVVYMFLRLGIGLVKSLTAGGARNRDLYMPRVGRRRRV